VLDLRHRLLGPRRSRLGQFAFQDTVGVGEVAELPLGRAMPGQLRSLDAGVSQQETPQPAESVRGQVRRCDGRGPL